MEPKPLSSQCYSHVRSTLFDANAIHQHGDLATYPIAVIGIWSRIDCQLAEFLSSFLHTPDLSVAMTMYQALPAGSKRVALEAAASDALSQDDLRLFRAVMKVIRPSQLRRHDYSHHLWGISSDLPDALLLADPKAWVRHMIARDIKKKALQDPSLWAKLLVEEQPSETPPNWQHIKVYDTTVFAHDLAAANAASAKVLFLSIALSGKKDAATAQVRQMLLSEPSIQQALLPPSLENTPSTPPQPRPRKRSPRQRREAALRKRSKK